MPTDIDIASNALLLVGDNSISSFDDPGAGATVAKALYPETYRMVLSEHPWTFALKEQELNKLSQSPDAETGYKNAFQVPGELIRIWAVFPHSNYTVVGNLIYSNENSLWARYVYKVVETALPPHVVKALEYKLAADFAIPVTEDAKKAALYEEKYDKQVVRAKSIDSQNKPPVAIIDSPFTDSRFGGSLSSSFGVS